MDLDARKRRVMQAVVEAYIINAQPVGSRTLARDYDLGVSPATIRNEMSDLEGMGYLEQPHTSAGRIPSDQGYRFYVDELVSIATPSDRQIERMRYILERRVSAVESVLQTAGRLLAEITDCLAVVASPYTEESTVNRVDIVPLRAGKAMLLVITNEGFVHNQMVDIPRDMEAAAARRVSRVLSEYFSGQKLSEIVAGRRLSLLRSELKYCRQLLDVAVEALSEQDGSDTDYHLEGAVNIMKQPEFQDVQVAQKVLSALSEQSVIRRLFGSFPREGMFVLIGRENSYEDIWDCSLVSAVYYIDDRPAGRLGVLGPRRMHYGKVLGVVQVVTDAVSEILSRF